MPTKSTFVLTLPELLTRSTSPFSIDDASPLHDSPCVAVRLDTGDTLAASEANALARWLRRLPCPAIAIAKESHPLVPMFDSYASSEREWELIARNIVLAPLAAMVLVQVLRSTDGMPAAEALVVESLAYATLQAGPEFHRWCAVHPPTPSADVDPDPPVLVGRDGERLSVRLNRPARRNAISAAMRDALTEALQLVVADPSIRSVQIRGDGDCFSIGGDTSEFGTAPDAASAHAIRSMRLPAHLLVQCSDRVEFRLHSACIGAGIEIPAFGERVVATHGAFFQLPELRFGLIPGAGGCVSVPRRIGRQRTANMVLSMKRISAATALAWGLIDAIDAR